MRNWEKVTLGELHDKGLADIQTGPFGTVLKASEYVKEGVPVISVGEIREGFIQITERTPRVSEETTSRLAKYILLESDIVFGRKGAIDRNSIINEKQDGWFLGSDGIRLRLSDQINSVFVSNQLRQSTIGEWLLKNSSGSIMASLNQKILDRLPLWLPELSTQNEIAKLLSIIDTKIDLNNRINSELEGMAKLIYDYWFVQFDFPISGAQAAAMGRPDLAGKPYKSSGGLMVFNEELKRDVPEGWEVKKINKYVKIGSGFPFKSQDYLNAGEYKIITIKNVQDNLLDTSKTDFVNRLPENLPLHCKLELGDMLISLTGNVGRICLVHELNLLLNQRVGKLLGSDIYLFYFYFFLNRPEQQKRLERIASGSSQKNLSPVEAMDYKTFIPNELILKVFLEKVDPIISKILICHQENKKLSELRDWLLPMLMNGQVRVMSEEEGMKMAAEPGTKYSKG